MKKQYTITPPLWRHTLFVWLLLCGLVPLKSVAQQFTIGANSGSNGTTVQPTPFANFFEGSRGQYLYRAPELLAAGMLPNMIITDLAFTVVNPNTSTAYNNYRVWIANTTSNSLATAYVPATALTLVHGPVTVPVPAPNTVITFPMTPAFVWDGTSNIVVQVFHNNDTGPTVTDWNANMSVIWTTGLPAGSSRSNWADNTTDANILNDGAFTTGTNTNRPQIIFTAIPPTPCSGAVTGGTAVATPSNFCNLGSTTLTVTGGTGLATGLTYQWQMCTTGNCGPASPDWQNIGGATTASLSPSPQVSTTTQFRRQITCTNGGSTDFSAPATFTNIAGAIPYAPLPYVQDFETWQDGCFTKELPGIHWTNTPVIPPVSSFNPNLAWRRQNEGSTAPNGGWTNPTNNTSNGNILPLNGPTGGVACFHSGGFPLNTPGGQQGWMDVRVDLSGPFTKEVRFQYRNRQQFVYVPPVPGADRQWMPVHADQLEVLFSSDGGVTFPTVLGVYGNDTPDSIPPAPVPSAFAASVIRNNWKKIAVKVGNVTGTGVIRFRATTSFVLPPFTVAVGTVQTDIGIDDLQVVELKPCSGPNPPLAGTIFANPRLCDPGAVYMTVTGSEDLLGGQDYEFEWQTSTTGTGDWTTVGTQPDYTTPILSTEPFYRRMIRCKNGSLFAFTPVIQIRQIRPTPAVVTPGLAGRYIQLFNNWVDGCQDKQFPDQSWKNTPNIGNRSWRNRADVTPANIGQWFIGFNAATASLAPQEGTGAAAYFSRGAVGAGDLDLYVNLSASTNRKAVQFYYGNTSGTDNLQVSLSNNSGSSFGAAIITGRAAPNPAWNKFGQFITSNSPNMVIRFKGQSGGPPLEGTDQGLDSLVVIDLVPCTTTPIGGQAQASPANFCMGSEITISVQRGSDDPAWATDDLHTFQWQICTTGNCGPTSTDWTDIPFATSGSYQLTATPQPQVPPRQYRRKIICPNGNLEAFSTAVTLEFPYPVAYAAIPYYNGFEDPWGTGAAAGTCPVPPSPTQAGIRPVTPAASVLNDVANTVDAATRGQHWRSTSPNNAATWRRVTGTTLPTGWSGGANWNAYGRPFPITPAPTNPPVTTANTGMAGFNGFGGSGQRRGNLDLYVNASGTQMKQVRFRYRNPQRPTTIGAAFPLQAYNDDNMQVSLSINNGASFSQRMDLTVAPSWLPYYINFDQDAPQAVVRFTGNSFATVDQNNAPEGTDMAIDEVFVVYVNDCQAAGTLVGGTTGSNATTLPDFNFCYFPPYAVFVTGSSDETHYGFEYQWEASEDGGTSFNPIAGATQPNLILLSARVGTFRRKITCTASGSFAFSTNHALAFTNPVTYASLPYRQDFEQWTNACGVNDSPVNRDASNNILRHWRNNPFNGQTSWRKNDEGRLANWNFNFPQGLPEPAKGSGAATFHTVFVNGFGVNAPTPPRGSLDLYVNCAVPGTKQLKFWYINPDIPNSISGNGNNDKLQVEFSTDGGVNFNSIAELTRQDVWQEFTYTFESTSSSTVVRFLGNWSADDSDIGIDELKIDALVPCVAVGDVGKAKVSNESGNACTTLSLALFVEPLNPNSPVQQGLVYQWQSCDTGDCSVSGSGWQNIPNATGETHVAAPLRTTNFRRLVKCGAGGTFVPSDAYTFFIASSPEYAPLPFAEDFERWGNACTSFRDVPIPPSNKIYWRTRPFDGDNAWRKTGDEAAGSWRDINEPGWQQGGRVIPATGNGAASFHSYSAPLRTVGDLELFINMKTTNTNDVKLLRFDYSNPDYPTSITGFTNEDKLEIFLSLDGGFTFGTTPFITLDRTKDLWETKRIVFDGIEQPLINSETVVFRFRGNSDNGGTDIGIDNISVGVMPKFDAGVVGIQFNRCSPKFGRVVVEVENFGSETIGLGTTNEFNVEYTIGGNTYSELFPLRLERFQKAKYEFATPFEVPVTPSISVNACTKLIGDAVASNDCRTVSINVANFAGIPASGVFEEKFESGIPANWSIQSKLNTPSWFSARQNDLLPVNVPAEADEFPFNPLQMDPFNGTASGFDGKFVALDDQKGGAARTFDSDRLITPSFDLSNHNNIQMQFGLYVSQGVSGLGELSVEFSTDGGNTWSNRITYRGSQDPPTFLSQRIENLDFPTLAGKGNVRFAFKFNDKGVISGGAAIDNFKLAGTLVANPIAEITTPQVNRGFVNRGSDAHTVYRFDVEAKDANVVLSDVILTTSTQEYKVEDFKQSSFRLYASTDAVLSANDVNIGTVAVVPEGGKISLGCINYAVPKNLKRYFFFTVDVANAPTSTIGDSIAIQLPVITDAFFTILGNRQGTGLVAGGYQIIVDPNTPPTAETIVFKMKKKTSVNDPNLTFKASDFKFKDVDPIITGLDLNKFMKMRISNFTTKTLNAGTLQLNGVDITPNQELSVNAIPNLVFTPRVNDAGAGYAVFTFKVFDGRDWSTNDYFATIDVVSDEIFLPTMFTPNGDGNNDRFMVRGGEGNIDKLTLKIVDRNNNPMFESSDVALLTNETIGGWDGTKDGKAQPDGAYMWYIEGTFKDGKPILMNGKKTGVIRLAR
jgi:gliding motility-associated-like protein